MNLSNKTLAFIGAGHMGEALIRGLLAAKTMAPDQLVAHDVRPERLADLRQRFGIRTSATPPPADIIILAVKPQQMREVLAGLATAGGVGALFISIAAGTTTGQIEQALGGRPRVVRVMPNTPALVGAGAAGLCRGAYATDDDLIVAETILGAVGITVRVSESLMNAVTALSGSGPAYVFRVAEAMIEAGQQAGLPADVARTLTIQTIMGAGRLMSESGEEPAELRRRVTSPGGTTAAALSVLDERQLMAAFAEAIAAAVRRGTELAGA